MLLGLLLCIAWSAASQHVPQLRITGGEPIQYPRVYPWLAAFTKAYNTASTARELREAKRRSVGLHENRQGVQRAIIHRRRLVSAPHHQPGPKAVAAVEAVADFVRRNLWICIFLNKALFFIVQSRHILLFDRLSSS